MTLTNVLVGEVWVCSGQSNMEWALKQTEKADDEIAASANDQLRLNSGKWQAAGPETSGQFSATGYYFGKALRKGSACRSAWSIVRSAAPPRGHGRARAPYLKNHP